jgi:hypothetical protein
MSNELKRTYVWDLDGVLAEWVLPYTTLIEEHYGLPRFSTGSQFSWYQSQKGLSEAEVDHIWHDHIHPPARKFWLNCPLLISTAEKHDIWALARKPGVEFVYVTNRTGDSADVGLQSTLWLLKHELPVGPVYVSRDKLETVRTFDNVQGIIDDSPKNINRYILGGMKQVWVRDWPFNRPDVYGFDAFPGQRVSSAAEFARRMLLQIED